MKIKMIEELYEFLQNELHDELKGNLTSGPDYVLYYRNDLSNDMDTFYKECIEDKNKIKNKLPNGFALNNFNYEDEYLSFQIVRR